jgi:hypothetical protein
MRTALALVVLASAPALAAADGLRWADSLEEARKSRRPIVYLRILGDLGGEV